MQDPVVILFYKFTPIADPEALKNEQLALASSLNMTGRVIIATEGINATFEGSRAEIEKYKQALKKDERFSDVKIKESAGTGYAFPKLSIKVRDEIVTLKAGDFDPKTETATELPAEDLQAWYENNEDFVVLDLRNDYEIVSGYFDKTINPKLGNFRDLNDKLPELAHLKDKKVVAVCTGGIRCEKATCLLKKQGFTNLYQLKDGIHTYMEKFPAKHFKGSLYVFDNRMVTPVKDDPEREIVGECTFCQTKTENYASDDSARPSKKILCCEECFETHKDRLRASVILA